MRSTLRLLTFNCHEAYVHLLGKLGHELGIVDRLPGRHVPSWDHGARPVPGGARLMSLDEALAGRWDAVIAHNLTDLLAARAVWAPKIFVVHGSLEARIASEASDLRPETVRDHVVEYLRLVGGTAIAVSELKRDTWRLDCDVIRLAADTADYSGYTGELQRGLRVSNLVDRRRAVLDWSAHEAITRDVPMLLLGHNPGHEGSRASTSWDDLKDAYRRHRFVVHTAAPRLEDGYNTALLEAMATGMPVVATRHPSSPVVDGVNGFVADDVELLRRRALQLVGDPGLARRLGEEARRTVTRDFGIEAFVAGWGRALEAAQRTFALRCGSAPAPRVLASR